MPVENESAEIDAGSPVPRFGDYFARQEKRKAAQRAIAEAEKAEAEAANKEALENYKKELEAIVDNIYDSCGGIEAFKEEARLKDDELIAALPEELRRQHEDISKRWNELLAAGKDRQDDPELSKAYVDLVQDPVYLQIYEQVYQLP